MSDIAVQCSPFFNQLVARHADWFADLQASGRLTAISPPQPESLQNSITDAGLDPALRQFRNREMMRLIWRDLNQQAPLQEILSDLSVLADICIQAAVLHHSGAMEEKHGKPRNSEDEAQQLIVLGLGKLGGNELNLSSDIDVIFCYPDKGHCDGRGGLANEHFFTRLSRKLIKSLAHITADGFCFRVDTRLRPFGDSGPLVSSFAALEQYYQREGRDWERYALIKARPVAGDLLAGQQLLSMLKPFIYRRYIDFGAIEALREMHQNVRDDAQRHDRLNDIKRGPGGIREIEFLVQTFQLLRGGRDVSLQTPSIYAAAAELRKLRLLPESVLTRLLSAYQFLRQVENRIQALHDQQTHTVPGGKDGLMVAQAMGFETIAGFQTCLGETRSTVQTLFEQSLPQPDGLAGEKNPWQAVWQRARNTVQGSGSEASDWKPLADFVKRLGRLSLSQRASRRLDAYMPVLLLRIASFSLTDDVVNRVFDLVSAICRRSAYLSLLLHNPQVTDRMLKLFAASKRVANAVTRYPALLDELIDPRLVDHPPGKNDIQAGVKRILSMHGDTETVLQNLNYHKHAVSLRIAVAVLRSTLTANEAQLALSLLAESLIGAALKLSLDEMKARHGSLPGAELAVIAYGSLGAESLGFDSDLDLIFLYIPQTRLSDGKRPIHAERYHTGVARRLLSLLSAITPSGRLYNIDARLRPNGRAGLLVSSLDSFSRYQQKKAWVWELQALTRARPVAGNVDVMQGFLAARQLALTSKRDKDQIRQEVVSMRKRVANQPGNNEPIKFAPGGLVDIEFVVQLGLLLNAEKNPGIVDATRLSQQLRALQKCGWLDFDPMQTLDTAYMQICQARQQMALNGDSDAFDASILTSIAKPLCIEILG